VSQETARPSPGETALLMGLLAIAGADEYEATCSTVSMPRG
jgi:hypothetical protein